jgi:hypothetical protein
VSEQCRAGDGDFQMLVLAMVVNVVLVGDDFGVDVVVDFVGGGAAGSNVAQTVLLMWLSW